MKQQAFLFAGLLVAAAAPSSCPTQHVRTVVHEDGSVDRAIVQNIDLTPESARRPGLWLESRFVVGGPDDPWDGGIHSLALPTGDQKATLFAARGHFASVAAVPDHYAEAAKYAAATSRLARTYTNRDLGIVAERTWTETLNDIATPSEMAQAREELSRINLKLLRGALDGGLGRDYDYDDYIRWVGQTYEDFFSAYAEFKLESRAAGLRDAEANDGSPLARAIAARYGISWLGDQYSSENLQAFVKGRTRTLIKRRDGRPFDPATADLIASAVTAQLVEFADADAAKPFKAGFDRVIAAEYGGAEAFEKRVGALAERMIGLTEDRSSRAYSFTLVLPGTVVETNGILESESRVRWNFKLGEAFAFGYTMRCRSLEPNAAAERAVPGAARLTSRDAMLRYVSLVDRDDALLEVVRQAIAEKRLAPIETYRAKLARDPQQAGRAEKAAKLMALLGMTVK